MGQQRYFGTTFCTAIALCLSCIPVCAQSASPASHGRELLAHLSEAADELNHRLPNFTCDESVLSQEIQQGKVRRHATFTTTIRAQRNSKGVLEEHLGDLKFEVGIFSAMVHHIPSLPIFVSGGFSHALDYFAADEQLCMEYRISGGRIDFAAPSPVPPACKTSGTEGFALVDGNENPIHIERKVEPAVAAMKNEAVFAAVDFAPVELNGHTYRLSRHVVAEMPGDNGTLRRFTADFSNCKLFTSTVTLLPGTPVSP